MRGFAGLGDRLVVLHPFSPMLSQIYNSNQRIELKPFFCQQADREQMQGRSPLCLVSALEFYIRATWARRVMDQLVMCFKEESWSTAIKVLQPSLGVWRRSEKICCNMRFKDKTSNFVITTSEHSIYSV